MLTTRQRYLSAIADRWGGLDLSSFSERLLLQKRMFLLSMSGIDLGHVYTWYIRGPYSPSLTRDAFAVQEARGVGGTATVSLPPALVERLDYVRRQFGDAWNDARKMELLASLSYLAKKYQTNDADSLSDKLTSLKSHFAKGEAANAIDWLAKHGLLNA